MKIAIVNQPLGNRGDESAHKAMIRKLIKIPGIHQVDVLFLNADDNSIKDFVVEASNVRYINIKGLNKASDRMIRQTLTSEMLFFSLIHPLLRKYVNMIKQYDCIVCAPGGICMGGFMNWTHVWALYVPMVLRKKILYWGRSIGPFNETTEQERIFKTISVKLLNYFSYISLRDRISCDIADELGVNYVITVDSAFLETPMVDLPHEMREKVGKKYVVFVPNQLTWHFKYKGVCQDVIDRFYLDLIDWLVVKFQDCHIVMLPQTYKTKINDFAYFGELKRKSAHSEKIIVIDENQSSDVQQTIIRNAIFLVGARYHSVIFAINNRIPFLSLSYEHKMRGILNKLSLDAYQYDIDKYFTSSESKDPMEKIVNMKFPTRELLEEKQKEAYSLVLEAFEKMALELS